MRGKIAFALLLLGLIAGLIAAGVLAYFIWSLDWGSGRRSWLIGTICLIGLPVVLWALVYFFFAWLATLIDEES